MLNRRCEDVRHRCRLLRFLMLAGIFQGAFPAAVAQTYGGFRPLGPQHHSAGTAAVLPQRQAVPGSALRWRNPGPVETLPVPYATPPPPAPMHGYKFRDMPGLPSAQDFLPKFRPDRQTGRFPSNWGRENNPWQVGSGSPPPVFRPLENGVDGLGRSSSGDRLQPGWGVYPSTGEAQDMTGRTYYPGWTGFTPSPGN